MARLKSPEDLELLRQELLKKRDPNKPCISICAGAGCVASGANEVIAAFKAEITNQGIEAQVDTKGTGCPGFCERGPVVVIYPEEICYLGVTDEDVPEIDSQTIKENKIVDRLLYVDPVTGVTDGAAVLNRTLELVITGETMHIMHSPRHSNRGNRQKQ